MSNKAPSPRADHLRKQREAKFEAEQLRQTEEAKKRKGKKKPGPK